jgi:hypothetical protein
MKRIWLVVAVVLSCTDATPAHAQLAPSALAYTGLDWQSNDGSPSGSSRGTAITVVR